MTLLLLTKQHCAINGNVSNFFSKLLSYFLTLLWCNIIYNYRRNMLELN